MARVHCLAITGAAGHAQRGWITLVVVPSSPDPQPQPEPTPPPEGKTLSAVGIWDVLDAGAKLQRAAHSHDAVTPHELTLNQGRKWATDEPLRAGMGRIRGLVEPQLGAAHAGKLTPAQYRELATQVETEVGRIVANCKLEPKADAMLHLVIADLGAGTDTMAGMPAASAATPP